METEVPGFELGKVMWNSLLPATFAPPDSLNIKIGADQLPTGFSPEPNRLSVRSYLIYRRRALDLLSPIQTDDLLPNNEGDRLLRLGEPQIQVALNGILVPFRALTDVGKPAKVQLRNDAARRAFQALLADVTDSSAKVLVDMISDSIKGNVARIRIATDPTAARRDIEARIHERMKAFPIAYVVQWTEPASEAFAKFPVEDKVTAKQLVDLSGAKLEQ